jgi:hypothetical protein
MAHMVWAVNGRAFRETGYWIFIHVQHSILPLYGWLQLYSLQSTQDQWQFDLSYPISLQQKVHFKKLFLPGVKAFAVEGVPTRCLTGSHLVTKGA